MDIFEEYNGIGLRGRSWSRQCRQWRLEVGECSNQIRLPRKETTLNISRDATLREVTAAYWTLARK
ncbi:hypothetical protein ACP70R_005043 [Stipagrostis hirtigluma subsp. patula]